MVSKPIVVKVQAGDLYKSVVIGIDLGASESYVAYVGKGIVDVVQNEVSKRATPTVVGFTDRERLLGDAALAQIRSNAKNTCRNFKHLLGRKMDAPDVQLEHFWSTAELCECADGHGGYHVTYKGESRQFSAVEITAMFLSRLRDITEKWCDGQVADVVIAIPSSYADVQRQALLDAAKIANLPVLRVMNEHTATALAYGIYRSNDFDPEKPMTVAFCSMGNSIFSVAIVQFVRGKLSVVCEKSDKVGGRELDECLMREFAAQFKKKVGCDPLTNKKAAFKLEDAVAKTKKILSANTEAGITCECLMDDQDFASQITRADLEKMCAPAMERARAVLQNAIGASGLKPEQIDSVELVGGGSRVPWVKAVCSEAFGRKDLSTTMNQEESVARGCALQAAMLSPLYKVRDFRVEDFSPFAVNVGWMGTGANAAEADEDGDTNMVDVAGEYNTLTVFPAGSHMNALRIMTFYRSGPFQITAEYGDTSLLLPGTPKELGTYRIELPPQTENKKVKVKARLTLHGTFAIEGAQMVEEEEYEDAAKETGELPPGVNGSPTLEQAAEGGGEHAPDAEAKPEGGNGDGKKEDAKKRKRVKKTDLKVTVTGKPGLSDDAIQKLMAAEAGMQAEMREIIETDERRNDLESYIFNMRNKIGEGSEYGPYITSSDRDVFTSELTKAEDWLYENEGASKTAYIEKLDELKRIGDAVAWRCKEDTMRWEWIQAVSGTAANYRSAAENPGDKFGHIAPEKLANITRACNELERWLHEMKAKQDTIPKHEKPVLLCADMERRNQELAKMADDILREPRPGPPKEERKGEAQKGGREEGKKSSWSWMWGDGAAERARPWRWGSLWS